MRFSPTILIFVVAAGPAGGQLLPGIDPSPPEPEAVESLPRVRSEGGEGPERAEKVVEKFSRIRLLTWGGSGEFEAFSERFEAETGLLVPSPRTLEAKLGGYFGRALDEGDLVAIADLILVHYDVEGYPVVDLEIPGQDFAGGRLEVRLEVGRIGRVGVAPPKYGDGEVLRAGLRLRPGELVERAALDEQLAWYGRYVFRRPRLFVSPGEAPATADLLIALEERRPWRVSLGYENSGTDAVGRERFQIGAAGLLPNEHLVAWQTVLGAPTSSLRAHAMNWEIPLASRHQTVRLEVAYAEVSARDLAAGLPVENGGTSWAAGVTHRFALPAPTDWRAHGSWGLEVKGTDQFVLFGGARFAPGEVRFFHLKAGCEVERRWKAGGLAARADVLVSPGGVLEGNGDADFRAFDAAADSSYVVGRISGRGWWSPGGDWRLGMRGAAQVSDARLLPAEQFAAGGHGSVRGVAEREAVGDIGWQASFEVVSPPWVPRESWEMRGVGFVDRAWLRNRGGGSSESFGGAGLGLRMRIGERVDFRLDQGWRLDDGGSRTHFGIRFSY